ncbi:MAG TPA: metalloregulator ArsR/SmtB family transcription factor [Rhizomicrobium sp.]|jgi:DNA-binding transcriptional ArsR family regulator|nr:metalloregulator ArsR/SmtB family transcription factor [Rhizomicrobium sp.]
MTYDIAFEALGDRTRRQILDRLRAGPCSVAALAAGLPVSRPAVSQHLKVLKDAGLVTDEAAGARRLYRAAPGGMMALRAWLDDFWNQVFADYEAEMQRQMDERRYT